jgi:hypothetical protein
MTEKRLNFGLVVRPISGGYQEKGGVNSSASKVISRPPAPAAMKPSGNSQTTTKRK